MIGYVCDDVEGLDVNHVGMVRNEGAAMEKLVGSVRIGVCGH